MAVADVPELTAAWLFAVEPTDRALAGWSPQTYVRLCYGSLIRSHAGDLPDPPMLRAWLPGTAGEAANSA